MAFRAHTRQRNETTKLFFFFFFGSFFFFCFFEYGFFGFLRIDLLPRIGRIERMRWNNLSNPLHPWAKQDNSLNSFNSRTKKIRPIRAIHTLMNYPTSLACSFFATGAFFVVAIIVCVLRSRIKRIKLIQCIRFIRLISEQIVLLWLPVAVGARIIERSVSLSNVWRCKSTTKKRDPQNWVSDYVTWCNFWC